MKINDKSILSKVRSFAKTAEGKEKIKESRIEAFDNNREFGKGSGITSKQDFSTISFGYLSALENFGIEDSRVSRGLRNIIDTVSESAIISKAEKVGKDKYKVSIEFPKGKLRRNSLFAEDSVGDTYYTGNGINNILALFNNGMDIDKQKNVPYGLWETHGIEVRAIPHRDALKFMQSTAQDFYQANQKRFEISSIDINEEYKQ